MRNTDNATYWNGLSEEEIIDRVLAGNAKAFGPLVQAYQDRLFSTIVHLVGCPHEAHDILQDAFVKALTNLSKFNRRSTFYTWIFRIAMNLTFTRQRRPKRFATLEKLADESIDTGDRPESRLEREETVALVRSALRELPDAYRRVLVLREIEELDYETIAEMLQIRVGTVRSRLHRARVKMRDQIIAHDREVPEHAAIPAPHARFPGITRLGTIGPPSLRDSPV